MLGEAPENRSKMGSRGRAPRCSIALESAENDGGACGLRRVIALPGDGFRERKEGETERERRGIRGRRRGSVRTLGGEGERARCAVPLPEREGETVREEDADRWVPPIIGGREGESYPFGILAGWAMGRLRNWVEWDPRGPFVYFFLSSFSFLFFLFLLYLLYLTSKQSQTSF
jgi:hypothetical protein